LKAYIYTKDTYIVLKWHNVAKHCKAVNTAIYVRNRCPSKALSGKIPEELWEGKRINLSHFKVQNLS
jgi:hypothetical protein